MSLDGSTSLTHSGRAHRHPSSGAPRGAQQETVSLTYFSPLQPCFRSDRSSADASRPARAAAPGSTRKKYCHRSASHFFF